MLKDIYGNGKTILSIEVFPPKSENDTAILFKTLDELSNLKPDFISITYGAGGGTNRQTMDIASYIQNKSNIEALAHLTCAALDESRLLEFLTDLKENGITNILALRGDKPKDMSAETFRDRTYAYAKDLVTIIKQHTDSCIGGACYPEVHPESINQEKDLIYLKEKADAGMDFLITQMFFDNQVFYNFCEKACNIGISIPISAGIMPITSLNQVKTIIDISGVSIPPALGSLLEKYKDSADDLKKAGMDYAMNQILDLLNSKVSGIHLYTLNKADITKTIFSQLGSINYSKG